MPEAERAVAAVRAAPDLDAARAAIDRLRIDATRQAVLLALAPEWRGLAAMLVERLDEHDLRLLLALLGQQYKRGETVGRLVGSLQGRGEA